MGVMGRFVGGGVDWVSSIALTEIYKQTEIDVLDLINN